MASASHQIIAQHPPGGRWNMQRSKVILGADKLQFHPEESATTIIRPSVLRVTTTKIRSPAMTRLARSELPSPSSTHRSSATAGQHGEEAFLPTPSGSSLHSVALTSSTGEAVDQQRVIRKPLLRHPRVEALIAAESAAGRHSSVDIPYPDHQQVIAARRRVDRTIC